MAARGFLNLGLFLLEKGSPLAKEVAEKISGHMHRVPRNTLLAKGNWMWITKALLVAPQRSPSLTTSARGPCCGCPLDVYRLLSEASKRRGFRAWCRVS